MKQVSKIKRFIKDNFKELSEDRAKLESMLQNEDLLDRCESVVNEFEKVMQSEPDENTQRLLGCVILLWILKGYDRKYKKAILTILQKGS